MGVGLTPKSITRMGFESDNRLVNLREATGHSELSERGRSVSDNASGHAGVFRNGRRWCAQIRANGERKHLGCFASAEEAGSAYLAARAAAPPF